MNLNWSVLMAWIASLSAAVVIVALVPADGAPSMNTVTALVIVEAPTKR